MNSKRILLPVAALAVAGFTLFGVTAVTHAQTGTTPFSGLAQMIAQKFGIDQTQVQSVVDQYREQQVSNKMQNLQQNLNTQLDNLVTQRKITTDQKTLIENEINSLKSKYNLDNLQNLSQTDRRTAIQNAMNDFQNWAKDNNLDLTNLHIGFGLGMGRGMGMGMHRGWDKDNDGD